MTADIRQLGNKSAVLFRPAVVLPMAGVGERTDGATLYLNARGAAFVGLAPEDTYGWSWLDLVHPDDLAMARLSWEDAIFGGLRYVAELRIRNADGQYRWVLSRGSPVLAPDGTLKNWVGTWTDIDDRRRFDAELQTARTEAAKSLNILETVSGSSIATVESSG